MKKFCQDRSRVRSWPWWLSGTLALVIIALLTLFPLIAMIVEAGTIDWFKVLSNTYIQRVIKFSLMQAALSTVLSLAFAIPVALTLAHKPQFFGRTFIVNLFSLSLVIPTIAAIYGIVAVFGRSGWVSSMLSMLSVQPLRIYGLPGILIAHVFFNMALAARILLVNLEGTPAENWRLAKQLGMRPMSILKYLEWPAIKNQLPSLAILIFSLCFTSFAIVMTLGGGPRATTIEVAIYQSLRFDFDINLAVALACVQLVLCIGLMAISTLSKRNQALNFEAYTPMVNNHRSRHEQNLMGSLWQGTLWESLHYFVLISASAFILLPLLALAVSSFNSTLIGVITDSTTLIALLNTTLVSLVSATLSLAFAIGLLVSTRHLRIRLQRESAGQWLQLAGNIILVLPPLVLGTGLFLLLRPYADVFSIALVLVIIINSLMALPFVLRVLDGPVMQLATKHDKLLQSLGLQGWNRWRWIDWPTLRKPISLGLALSATLAAGDLSAIALFGSERVQTLPLLLYQRMGSYRLEEAAVTAGILLLVCLLLFMTLQRLVGGKRHAAT